MLEIEKLIAPSTRVTFNVKGEMKIDGMGMITPMRIAKDMVNVIPDKEFNRDTKFLDIACKSGNFLRCVHDRLMTSESMIKAFPNDRERHFYIINNQLYGVALQQQDVMIATRNVYGQLVKDSHIVYIPSYIDRYISCRDIKGLQDKLKELTGQMKFDVIIGNPPYNDGEKRGGVGSGNAIYQGFMRIANDLGANYTSLIVPSGWMLQYPSGTTHATIDNLRKNKNIVCIHDYKNSEEVFSGVSIPNGVCYYLTDKNKNSEYADFYIHDSGSVEKLENIEIYNKNVGVIFRDKYVIKILNKINKIHKEEKRFNTVCVGAKHHFDDGVDVMESTWTGYSTDKTEDYNIMYFLKSSNKVHKYRCTEINTQGMPSVGYGWVRKDQIPRNESDYKRHKLIVGQAFTAGSPQVMDIPEYIGDNSVCSHSYVPIFSPNNTVEECYNISSYIKTRFFRYLVNCMKSGQNLGNRVYSLVPMQNFSNSSDINWNCSIQDIEKQLYKKYKLSADEVEYIEKTIKAMN